MCVNIPGVSFTFQSTILLFVIQKHKAGYSQFSGLEPTSTWISFTEIESGQGKHCQEITCLLCLQRRASDLILIRTKIPRVGLRCGLWVLFFFLRKWTNNHRMICDITWITWSVKRIPSGCREAGTLVIFLLVLCFCVLEWEIQSLKTITFSFVHINIFNIVNPFEAPPKLYLKR